MIRNFTFECVRKFFSSLLHHLLLFLQKKKKTIKIYPKNHLQVQCNGIFFGLKLLLNFLFLNFLKAILYERAPDLW